MIDPSPTPSRQLRIFAHVARWSLGLVMAFWLLLAVVWGTLHGFIVPRIDEWRVEVESLATQALGAPVRIRAIEAKSEGLFPTIHLSGVAVQDDQGRDALNLDAVVVTVSARSVLRLGVEQLYIDGPRLDIRHLQDGRWQVAGMDVVASDRSESHALDWLLQQPELVIHKGVVSFTDEQRDLGVVQLHDVDMVVRHRHWRHLVRLDATPSTGEGERMQLLGAFRQPLLPSSQAPWTRWSGQWYASMSLKDVPPLPWPQAWGVESIQGNGMARAWVDIQHGQPAGITADVLLPQMHMRWKDSQVTDFAVQQVRGRIEAEWQEKSWRIQGRDFSFIHPDGSHWPASNWALSAIGGGTTPARTNLELDYADLAMASKVAQSLPVPAQLQQGIEKWTPQGQLRQLRLQWSSTTDYAASGHVYQLMLQPQPFDQKVGIPGVQGLNAAFEFNAQGGKAELDMQAGALHFPGVFEDPVIPLDAFQAQLRWKLDGENIQLQVAKAQFANVDAQGSMSGMWRTGGKGADRLPGYLHIQGLLERADGARVHRYLPLAVPEMARHYVRDSVQQGTGSQVEFEVKGNLKDMPFDRPGTGRFFIKAPVKDVVYAFVPPSLHVGAGPAWPALTELNGTLVFEGAGMQVQQAATGFVGHRAVRMHSIQAQIPNLHHPHLTVNVSGHPDLNATLDLVKHSPLSGFTSHALDGAQAQGEANVAFDLDLPIDHLEQSKVRGRIGFAGNRLQLNADTPALHQLQGAVHFHEQGFELKEVRGQSLGGSIKIGGGMPSPQQGVRIQAKGIATSQGLNKEAPGAVLKRIAENAQGQAAYTVDVTAVKGQQVVAVHSDLRGIALHLPAPLNKAADAHWPLSVTQSVSPQQVQDWHIDVAGRGSVRWVQDGANSAEKSIQGQILVGAVTTPIPMGQGISAQIQMPELDVDAWMHVLDTPQEMAPAKGNPESANAFMPHRLVLSVDRLVLKDRELEGVKADFSQSAGLWRGKLDAKNFAGDVEYRARTVDNDAGRLFARLSHLSIPKSETQKINQAEPTLDGEVKQLPALDIEVERLEIAGKSLGKLQLKARNTIGNFGRDWMLDQFYLETPEARWKANGYWGPAARGAPRSTHLSFLLEMESSGKLLSRFGMPGVIRDGQGRLSGNIAWQGAPITPDWHTMDGGVHMQVEKGQFLKVDPGMGKLLSVLSLQSLTRRMSLDFRDVFSQGFAFDYIRGDVAVANGVARTNNLQMKGLNAAVLMEGQASLVDETQDLKVVVVPEINAMTASLAATAINPVIGVGSFVAQMFLRGPLMEAATRTFHVHGKWEDPVVEPVSKKTRSEPAPSQEGDAP